MGRAGLVGVALALAVGAPLRWRQRARRLVGARSRALLARRRLAGAASPQLVWLRSGKATHKGGCAASRLVPRLLVGALVRWPAVSRLGAASVCGRWLVAGAPRFGWSYQVREERGVA